jgi:hypothetical protein
MQDIVQSLLKTRLAQSTELQKHFDALSESQKREHAQTRATFVYSDGEKRKSRVQLTLLESLRFPMMNHRYEKIAQAHKRTFLWIFKDPQRQQKPWDNFKEWLSTGDGTYWVQGKAASGKSTLMRFIWNNPQTLKYLQHWTQGQHLVVGAFFFWNSGIPDQRSQSGLLRSLLYEALKKQTELLPDILSEQWEKASELVAHDLPVALEEWTLSQLKRAFKRLILHASQNLKFCFFIDGLDEYDGDPNEISQFFSYLSKLTPHAKFCVSSRPWPEFQDIYEGVPGLKLQDLTRDDITLYIRDEVGKSKQMKTILLTDSEDFHMLLEEIIEKAAGVFLWVILAVKSLVSGLRNGDNVCHLRRSLAALPSDLEDLYGHMLDKIEDRYKEEASQIFQIFRTSGQSLDVPTLERALRYPTHHDVVDLPTKTTNLTNEETERIDIEIKRMILRLNSRTKGLLEVPHTETTPLQGKKVADCSGRSLPRTSLPFATVWFDNWMACGSEIYTNKNSARPCEPLEDHLGIQRHYQQPGTFQAYQQQFQRTAPPTTRLSPQWVSYWQSHTVVDSLSNEALYDEKSVDFDIQDIRQSPRFGLTSSKTESKTRGFCQTPQPTSVQVRTLSSTDPSGLRDWLGYTDGQYLSGFLHSSDPSEIKQNFDVGGLNDPQNQDLDIDGSSNVDDESIADDAANTDSNSDFLRISYLHRTVRDYLEQEHIWKDLLGHNKQIGFDPRTALLAADVLELKTTAKVMCSASVFDGGMEAIARVGRLAPMDSETQFALLEEFGRAIGAHWVGERARTRNGQLSRAPEDYVKTRHLQRQIDVVDILSIIMPSVLRWYINTRLLAPELPPGYSPSSTLLAWALGVDFWCLDETVQGAPAPDANMVETLLCLGCDPNAPYKGYTIWEYTVSYIHILIGMEETLQGTFSNLIPWMRLCAILLQHGANPNACCVTGYHSWWLKIKYGTYQTNDQLAFRPTKVFDESLSSFDKTSQQPCSVTSVFAQVFERKIPLHGARELRYVLQSKIGDGGKKRKRRNGRQRTEHAGF